MVIFQYNNEKQGVEKMKLFKTIKNDPKKRSVAIGIFATLVLIAIIASCIIASISQKASEGTGGGNDSVETPDTVGSIAVFNPTDDTQGVQAESTDTEYSEETLAPIDVSGINGLNYVSLENGTCSVDGIGTCTLTEIEIPTYSPSGEKVVKLGDGAFSNCKSIVSISIPASVRTIGTGVFRGCSSLSKISVSSDNPVYCSVDGVLFSEDKSVLICAPMNVSVTSYLLSTEIKAIAAFAFEEGSNITCLLYEGNVDDFQKIEILEGNDYFKKISLTLNYVPE